MEKCYSRPHRPLHQAQVGKRIGSSVEKVCQVIMNIDQLIAKLQSIKTQYGNLEVTIDDFYTPASLTVDVYVENRACDSKNPLVVVVRN